MDCCAVLKLLALVVDSVQTTELNKISQLPSFHQWWFVEKSMSYPKFHRWLKLNATQSRISALAPDNWRSPDLDYWNNQPLTRRN